MSLFRMLRKKLSHLFRGKREIDPARAYDLWAPTYDVQPGNLLIYLDTLVFDDLADRLGLEHKMILDFGCGTGRHWDRILSANPSGIVGYDVSREMLNRLRGKYPDAKAYLLENNTLAYTEDASCDVVLSNLVIGYVKDLEAVCAEWNRVLKPEGTIIVTDFHPDSLEKGATRSFQHEQTSVLIRNYIHPLSRLRSLAEKFNWEEVACMEKKVDDSVRFFYQQQNALPVFEAFYGTALLYALQFRKKESLVD